MAEQISASKPNATVVQVTGTVFLRDATGKSVPLKEGQQLNENEIFVTSANGHVQLLMPNGELLDVGGDRTVQLDAQMLGISPVDAAAAAIANLDASTKDIAAAIAGGKDLSISEEATAAGLGAGVGGEGHSFVELTRIAEGVTPLAFNFAGADLGTPNLPPLNGATVQPDIVPSPNPAILGPDVVSGAEDAPVAGNVLSNDSDADGPLTVTGFTVAGFAETTIAGQTASIPNVGTLTIAPNGDFTFTPVANYNGPVPVVTYNVVDPVGGTGSSTLTLTVTPVEDPANLQADTATLLEDTPATGNVLSNDSDPDGALSVTGFAIAGLPGTFTAGQLATIPDVGTLLIAANGDYTFTPVANYNGPVPAVTYNVVDPLGGTGSSTLTLTITPANDPANLQADSATLLEDTPATGNVLSNDSDPDGALSVTGFAIAGLPGTFTAGQLATIPDVGTLLIAANGDYTFTPVANYNGPVPVATYNVVDPLGGTGSSTLTLTITPVDDPVISQIEVGSLGAADDNVVEGNNLVFNVTLSAVTTQAETYAFSLGGGSASAADYGTAVFSNGVTFDPATGLITVPAGVTTFAVTLATVDDLLVEASPETVPLTIGGVSVTGGILDNDSPTIRSVEAGAPGVADDNVNEGLDLVFNVALSATTNKAETYSFNLGGGTATAGTDYNSTLTNASFTNGVTYDAATGKITVPAGVTDFSVTVPTLNDTISGEPIETVNLTIGGQQGIGGIIDITNRPPVIGNASATVSEEGLLGGIADTTGSPTDTTNSTVSTGTIAISDPDSPILSTTLIAPTDILSSGGHALVWSGSGTQNLVGKVGSTTIAEIQIDNAGHYTVTLKGPIDHPVNSVEDVKSFNVSVQVSDGSLSSTGTLTVKVEDDAPVGQSKTADVQIPNVDSNLILTIDVSGSMGDASGIAGKTRLQVAKEAITKLIDDYDVLGDVKVMLVTFSSSAATQQSGGQTWMSVGEAKAILANLIADGGTNYDAAVGQVMTHHADAGKIVGAQNIGYFFSDGAPNPGLELDANETLAWTNFLNAQDINSLALGLGTGVTATNLNPLAYNGTSTGTEANAIIVTDLAQLPPILRDTIVVPNSGDLTGGVISGASSGFGADGGHMNDITVDGVKYTFDVAHNSVVTTAAAGTYTFDAVTHQLKVNTVLGGQFAIDMDDGKYTYTPPVLKTSGSSENIGFTLIDNDGDLDTSNSHLTINIVPPAQGSTLQLTASTTAIADATRGLHGEFFGYNNDPDKSTGITYNVQTQDNTVGNLDNISDITSVINGRQGSNIVGTQTEASALASDATFIADAIKYGVTPTVTGNLGTNNAVTAGSAITAGNLYNFLGANNAGADTAGLAATSTFGNTTDSIMRMVGGAYFAAGTYDIRVYADDGFRIAVDGLSVFEYNANQPPTTRVQTGVVMSEGMHNLEVLYWEQGGNAALKVEFKPSGSADSAYVTLGIDDMALFHGTQAPVLSALQDIIEDPSNNGHYLVRSGQEVTGTNLSDTITGSAGRDIIHGGAGNDVINAGAGADRLDGGAGDDTLTGGLGADTFSWALADKGSVGVPAVDKITDFSTASYNAGGDRLDLKDLLQGENHTSNTGNLTQYLHFEKSGTDTIIHVSSAGAYTGPFNSGADDQRIVLSGVDLTSNGSLADAAIIQDLLNKGKLITD